jgi:hypothetical protein
MVCSIRVSALILYEIKKYANMYNTLFFLEVLFSTICKKNNLQYDTPDEFKTIEYRKDYNDTDINKYNLFHPVKDITKHIYYRNMLK